MQSQWINAIILEGRGNFTFKDIFLDFTFAPLGVSDLVLYLPAFDSTENFVIYVW